jgi:hypothetical protein
MITEKATGIQHVTTWCGTYNSPHATKLNEVENNQQPMGTQHKSKIQLQKQIRLTILNDLHFGLTKGRPSLVKS